MKIVLATFGSLGDLHPMLALGIELQARGHEIIVAAMEFYRERVEKINLGFRPMRPHFDVEDRELAREVMNSRTGPEKLIREIIMPGLGGMYDDLADATAGADLLVTGEVVYVAKSLVEKTGIKWISTSLAPLSFFSSYDPNVYPTAEWYEHLHFMPVAFHQQLFKLMRRVVYDWLAPYRAFRRDLGLDENHDPVFFEKNSNLLHLAMFSKVLAKPQPDWHKPTLQTGFCFYDGQKDFGQMPAGLQEFLDAGEPPIVFTLGSAAVWDAGNFYEESARAAKILNRRAVLIHGFMNEPPQNTDENIFAVDYAPFSRIFPRAAGVVHQAGVGTTGQVLRAGAPALIMPYGHDQFDNAARCARRGVARRISRVDYTAEKAARELRELLSDLSYKANASEAAKIVQAEHGTKVACDAVEQILQKK
ncbi:MAG TPA: glycosyltransferase [Pyrinomonadaceae bacterium]|jgi:UDP:flavonoid glycosyltransferase YjiC (YdhE family)